MYQDRFVKLGDIVGSRGGEEAKGVGRTSMNRLGYEKCMICLKIVRDQSLLKSIR